jgi:uncharacterized protein YdeI (YjbR/CyaY-like superfamily)
LKPEKNTAPAFFADQDDFRQWLDANHASATELLVGFYKVGSGRPSMTWPQSVDQALCFGWIDGVRKSVDDTAYTIRFTPRKATSIWSAVNIDKMAVLQQNGMMQPAGLAAFAKRREDKSRVYSHERTDAAALSPEMEAEFKANTTAWAFFTTQAPSYQKVMLHWITSAKQEKTRRQRFEATVKISAEGKRMS